MNSPKRVDIRFGYSCNNNCVFCVVQDSRNKYPDMDTKQVKALIRDAHEKGAEQITFTGGEPTIREDMPQLVKYSKKLGFRTIMFTTNGRRFAYFKYAKSMVELGVNKFMVSLHAHNDELYTRLTNSPGGFQQVLDGIKNLQKLDQLICASFVVNKHNYGILPDYAQFLADNEITELLQLTYVMPAGGDRELNKKNIPRFTDAVPKMKQVIDSMQQTGIKDIIVMDVPICFMQGYEQYINEFSIPDMQIHAPNPEHQTEDYNERRKSHKMKPKQCLACKHDALCEGIWPEYHDLYGGDELIPVR
jgi:MoaA/NifB/PqqE/SkfB family radical SAM enzyme